MRRSEFCFEAYDTVSSLCHRRVLWRCAYRICRERRMVWMGVVLLMMRMHGSMMMWMQRRRVVGSRGRGCRWG